MYIGSKFPTKILINVEDKNTPPIQATAWTRIMSTIFHLNGHQWFWYQISWFSGWPTGCMGWTKITGGHEACDVRSFHYEYFALVRPRRSSFFSNSVVLYLAQKQVQFYLGPRKRDSSLYTSKRNVSGAFLKETRWELSLLHWHLQEAHSIFLAFITQIARQGERTEGATRRRGTAPTC